MARPVVLLPQPDSPTRPSVSPFLTPKVMSSTARTQPTWRCRMIPWVIGKYIFRCSTCSSSPSAVPLLGVGGRGSGVGDRGSDTPHHLSYHPLPVPDIEL